MLTFLGVGGVVVQAAFTNQQAAKWRKLAVITHGVGLLLLLLGGFGALAKLGIHLQGWVIVKIGIWVVVGALPFVLRRKPELSLVAWMATLMLGAAAAFLALFRPF